MSFSENRNISPDNPRDHRSNTTAWLVGGLLVLVLLVAGGFGYSRYYVAHDTAGVDSASTSADNAQPRTGQSRPIEGASNTPGQPSTTGSGAR